MATIIALTGKAGSGKSTVAAWMAKTYGFRRVRFADPLKDMLRSLYWDAGVDDETIRRKIEGDLKEQPCAMLRGKTPRQAMQWLGTEWGREMIGADFWTELWALRAFPHEKVVVEDCRFDNEAEAVRRAGGIIVEITRVVSASPLSGKPLARTPIGAEASAHSSEKGLSGQHAVIANDGTIEALCDKFEPIVQAVIGGV